MARMTFSQIEQNVAQVANRASYTKDLLYELLAAYGRSKSSITKLRNGNANLATAENEVLQKDVAYFKVFPKGTQLEPEVYKMNDLIEKYHPRYVIATDLENLAAKDLKKGDTLTIPIRDIDRHVTFFYGWTGNEVIEDKEESVLDRRAADCMKDFYDEVEKINRTKLADTSSNFRHDLNIFFSRLLFCFFAEDTGLFMKNQFSDAIKNYTEADGSDLKNFFERLFDTLDTSDRSGMGQPFSDFPYVDGSIFDAKKHSITVPEFDPGSRYLLLRCSDFDWSSINPDIFGTIFQGIVDEKRRDENGMDYTSVTNIEKVINPLFMDELEEEFEKSFEADSRIKDKNAKRIQNLWKLWDRIAEIKIFDPACGSGNFLIISYKRLRELELRILDEITTLRGSGFLAKFNSRIKLENFYGIELEDFPRELAVLSMYIAEHQMNMAFEGSYGKKIDMLPITDMPHIICGNAARLDWGEICPNTGAGETYLIGNPPYKGSKYQNTSQKSDKDVAIGHIPGYKKLDYIAIWFLKAADFIKKFDAKVAFVTTNSICEGEQVSSLWPNIFKSGVEIGFAYSSFKWTNNAKDQAGVTVNIIGLSSSGGRKYLFTSNGLKIECPNINGYLVDADNVIVTSQRRPLCLDSTMSCGSRLDDNNGQLKFSKDQYDDFISRYPDLENIFRVIVNANDVLKGTVGNTRALWLEDYQDWHDIVSPEIFTRVKKISEKRPENPHLFSSVRVPKNDYMFIPQLSSERRDYIPIVILSSDLIPLDPQFFIDDFELYLFAILESKMHTAWIRTVCGKLETRYRYSSTLGYNTFPCPPLTSSEKKKLTQSAENILMARENHSEMTLADMYDPDKMPDDLRRAHEENDVLVDKLYRNHAFASDEERLAVLFDLYEKMVKNSQNS